MVQFCGAPPPPPRGVVSGTQHSVRRVLRKRGPQGSERQRKDERKQELALIAVQQIQEARRTGLVDLYTDGSASLWGGVGWVAGYGCHEPGLWEEANHLPVGRKQTINRAELMAVIVAVRRTHTPTTHVCSCNRLLVRVRRSSGSSHQMESPAVGDQQRASSQCGPVD